MLCDLHNKKLVRLFYTIAISTLLMSLSACSNSKLIDLESAGPISYSIDELLWITLGLMLVVLIPVFGMTAWFSWRYRSGNRKARYTPEWSTSHKIEWVVWLFPTSIVIILASLTWVYTHRLDPYKPLQSNVKPIEIQVVALDWKWLFIYPEEDIAVVNQLAFPVNTPVNFTLTSDTVMNAFFIPRLGGQIYTMAGMQTQLHLMANEPGNYYGENTQYSGRGFPFQNFEAIATTQKGYFEWLDNVRQSKQGLNDSTYEVLAKPSIKHPVSYYGSLQPALFEHILNKYNKMSAKSDNNALQLSPVPLPEAGSQPNQRPNPAKKTLTGENKHVR